MAGPIRGRAGEGRGPNQCSGASSTEEPADAVEGVTSTIWGTGFAAAGQGAWTEKLIGAHPQILAMSQLPCLTACRWTRAPQYNTSPVVQDLEQPYCEINSFVFDEPGDNPCWASSAPSVEPEPQAPSRLCIPLDLSGDVLVRSVETAGIAVDMPAKPVFIDEDLDASLLANLDLVHGERVALEQPGRPFPPPPWPRLLCNRWGPFSGRAP